MKSWQPYRGERYLSMDEVEAWCSAAAEEFPELALEEIGQTRHNRSIQLLTLTTADGVQAKKNPAFWLDGGTHASEWSSVMSVLYSLSQWLERLQSEAKMQDDFREWLSHHTIYAVPCVSPDGYHAMYEGAPFLRSSLRPPQAGTHRTGLAPSDVDGDGAIRWMRWRHPSGPFVQDKDVPIMMRPRTLDDDPSDAFFYCQEGTFLSWDGHSWVNASREFGLDLNRNFPGHWKHFQMFGMDGGSYPLSAPESRAITDAVAARPNIAAAISNHTYTGALLTQPYRPDTPLQDPDIALMEALAQDAVAGTGYKVLRVHPDFTYNPKRPIGGVWSDTLTTVFGIPGYTLELWDPYGHCGLSVEKPAEFFRKPDLDIIKKMLSHFIQTPASPGEPPTHVDWHPFQHPQLGEVELGGIDYMRTFRNPPTARLAAECQKGFLVADRARRALPHIEVHTELEAVGEDSHLLTICLENTGFLPTASLQHTESLGIVPQPKLTLSLGEGLQCPQRERTQVLHHLDGWGQARAVDLRHPLYPRLPQRGHRATAQWLLTGRGSATIQWQAGRAGAGSLNLTIT